MQAPSAQQVAAVQPQAAAQALLGGYKADEQVFYMGQGQTFADGDKLVHGQQGKVAGMWRGNTHLAVLFSGNKGHVGLRLTEVRRLHAASAATAGLCPTHATLSPTRKRAQISRNPPPPLHGGYKLGDKLFYTWPSRTFEHNGRTYKLVQGQQGEVMGPGTGQHEQKGTGLAILFPGNTGCVDCVLAKVSYLHAASAAILPASHTRDAAHTPSGRPTATASASPPPLQAQP